MLLLAEIGAHGCLHEHSHLLLFICATSRLENPNLPGWGHSTASTPSQALRQIGMVTCTPMSVSCDSKCYRIHLNAPNSISTRKKFHFIVKGHSQKQTCPGPSSDKTNILTPELHSEKYFIALFIEISGKRGASSPSYTSRGVTCDSSALLLKKFSNMKGNSDTWEPSSHFCTT